MLHRLPKVEAFNKSTMIIFESINFGEIIIDKVEDKIINNNKNITEKLKRFSLKNTSNYNLAIVCYKMLQNETDEGCRNFLRLFDKVKIE